MTEERTQKPALSAAEGPKGAEPTTGLTPAQIGAVLGLAALAWMIADWVRWVT